MKEIQKEHKEYFTAPAFDIRILTLVLCTFAAGLYCAARTGSALSADGNGNILLSLAVSVLKYSTLISLCILCKRYRICIAFLLLYDSVCSVLLGYYVYSFFCLNTVVLLAVVLPMIIYCYVLCVLTSAALQKEVTNKDNGAIIDKEGLLMKNITGRSRIILAAILLEGVIAPCIH